MPGVTTCLDLPYPTGTDPINVAADIQALAVAVDDALCSAAIIRLGVIVAWWDNGGTPPIGTLRCDGAPFDPAIYPELAAHLGSSNTPDLRGKFLRGTDAPGGPFPGNGQSGGWADAQLPTHNHTNAAHNHAIDHDHGNHVIAGGDHQHTINHGHAASTSAAAGQHGHGMGSGDIVPYKYPPGGLGFPVTGNPGNVFWWQYSERTFVHDGNHQHTTYTSNMTGSSGSVGHSHNVDIPNYTGVSSLLSSGPTSDAGAPAANRNIPPFMNVTYIIQAEAAPV